MDCSMIHSDLIAYCLGTLSVEENDRFDMHMLECSECLRAYLGIKRQMQWGETAARPSSQMRERLRADVQAEFGKRTPVGIWSWVRRPIPLYQSLAAAAVVALVTWAVPARLARSPSSIRHDNSGIRVDSSRERAQSLSLM